MSNIIDSLNWRYATKVFDRTKKVSKDDLNEIIEAFRLTSSSFWLQAWKLLVIQNQDVKDSLVEHSWWQKQVSDCSDLLVFCRFEDVWDDYVDKYIDKISKTRWIALTDLDWFSNMLKWTVNSMNLNSRWEWMAKQLYIAMGNLLTVLALKKIDSCPMEWFIKDKYDEILNLKEKWLKSVLVLPIWYRSEDDKYANLKKVRFDRENIVEVI